MSNRFKLLDTIIKSRLLSLNDEGYGDIMAIDVDSFRKRYKDAPDEKLDVIYEAFSDSLNNYDAYGPEYMINSYIKASDVYNSVNFDWGRSKQLASRKKFCRWMFKQAYLNNPELHEEIYSPKKDDWALFNLFKPNSDDSVELIDIAFTMLLTFQVIRPFGSDTARALKYSNQHMYRENMVELLKLLQKDLPSLGVSKSIHSIEEALNMLTNPDFDECSFPPAAYWGILNNISCDLSVNSSPKELSNSHVELDGYVMSGIWIDDYDDGQKRFWIFPNNKLMAFCYYFKNEEWILKPYEFVFTKFDYEFEFDNVCAIATSKGNMQVFLSGKIENEEFARLRYELGDRDDSGRFQTISFTPEGYSEFPYWMDWRQFCRLDVRDGRFKKFSAILNSIYHESEMLRTFSFRNDGRWMTDSHDCLLGLDAEFLYLSDIALDNGGILKEIEEDNDFPNYNYYPKYSVKDDIFNLFSIEISERQPIYVVPRDYQFYKELDKILNRKALVDTFQNPEDRSALLRKYEDFKEIVTSIEYKNQITIYKNLPHNSPSVLCFNELSRTFIIDEITTWFGVRKYVSREELLNSDIFNWRKKIPKNFK